MTTSRRAPALGEQTMLAMSIVSGLGDGGKGVLAQLAVGQAPS